MEYKKKIRDIKEFGYRFALALNILGTIMFYRQRGHFIWFTSIGSISLILALIYPNALNPLKKILDSVILLIGRLVNAISLIMVFYLIFTPIGILLKFLRMDLLNQKIDEAVSSYWIRRKRSTFSIEAYERMG